MKERLQAVKEFLELSLSNEKELQELVFLAAEICGTPIASITLVDDQKQYPVVGYGNVVESTCDIALCNHTIKETSLLEIPDASQDPRFSANPLVVHAPYIRFYAGIPLITGEGFAIGSLCVIDHNPKKLTAAQVRSLQILAKQVMQRLELIQNFEWLKDGIGEMEHKKELLEQAEVMKAAFYDGCEDFFLLLNLEFEVVSFNPAMENLFKFIGSPIHKGSRILDHLKTENVAIAAPTLQCAKTGTTSTIELLANEELTNASWHRFTISPTYNRNKELIGIAAIGCNIHQEKIQEEKLALQKSTLSKIASLHAHEIRHPLTNILGIVNILKQDDCGISNQFLEFLESSSKELDEVIRKIVLESVEVANN